MSAEGGGGVHLSANVGEKVDVFYVQHPGKQPKNPLLFHRMFSKSRIFWMAPFWAVSTCPRPAIYRSTSTFLKGFAKLNNKIFFFISFQLYFMAVIVYSNSFSAPPMIAWSMNLSVEIICTGLCTAFTLYNSTDVHYAETAQQRRG